MNNNLSRFADSKVYFQCPICTKSMDIQGNSLICRHGHCFDISRYGYVNLLLKSSPKTNYSKRSFDNRHQILEYGMYDVVLEKIIQFISDTPSKETFQMLVAARVSMQGRYSKEQNETSLPLTCQGRQYRLHQKKTSAKQ